MSDKMILTAIEVYGRHGCSEAEQRRGQVFKVDVEMDVDLAAAGASDKLTDTVDYAAVLSMVEEIVGGEPRNLIEPVAEEIAATILKKYARVEAVKVVLHKPDAPLPVKYADAAVSIVRARK